MLWCRRRRTEGPSERIRFVVSYQALRARAVYYDGLIVAIAEIGRIDRFVTAGRRGPNLDALPSTPTVAS